MIEDGIEKKELDNEKIDKELIVQRTQQNLDILFRNYEKNTKFTSSINSLQTALDIVWFEPTAWSFADATNIVISVLRSALADEKDEQKKHLINAGISAISLIPFADVIKLLKLRKSPTLAKWAIKWARYAKSYANKKKIQGSRFDTWIDEKSDYKVAA